MGDCPKCHQPHQTHVDGGQPRCQAHSKRSGEQCRRAATPDHDVCATHGSKSPASIEKAEQRAMNRRAAAYLSSHGIDLGPTRHPIEGLMLEVQRSAAAVEFYGMLVAELDVPERGRILPAHALMDEDLANLVGVDEEGHLVVEVSPGALYGRNHQGDGAPHVLVTLWNQERDRHARLCKAALDAGVAERQVRMTEEVGRMVAEVINRTLADESIGLPPDRQALARSVAARHLAILPAPSNLSA